jgi:hypothetical protein
MSSPDTRAQINALFSDHMLTERLVTDMSRALPAQDNALGYSKALLDRFITGFSE